MSANMVEILRRAGFVPVFSGPAGHVRRPQTQAVHHAPVAPAVPVWESKVVSETAEPPPIPPPDADKVRAHLLVLAQAEYLDVALVCALPESELVATGEQCAMCEGLMPGLGLEVARQYLRTLAEEAVMRAGRLPSAYDTPALCRHCGPVWLPYAQVAQLDVVDGWPTAWGCPWCFIHLPPGMGIPRPRRAGPRATYGRLRLQ